MSDSKKDLEEITSLMEFEAARWNELGLHPNNLQGIFSPELFFIVAMKLDALITFLQEKDIIIDRDEFEVHYRRKQFNKLREIRHKIQEDQKKQSSDIVTPRPVLLGPDGHPVKV